MSKQAIASIPEGGKKGISKNLHKVPNSYYGVNFPLSAMSELWGNSTICRETSNTRNQLIHTQRKP